MIELLDKIAITGMTQSLLKDLYKEKVLAADKPNHEAIFNEAYEAASLFYENLLAHVIEYHEMRQAEIKEELEKSKKQAN